MREQIAALTTRPRLLLHVCCAPCAVYCIEELSRSFDLILDFYNPNLETEDEYDKRLGELTRLVREMPDCAVEKILHAPYRHADFLARVSGQEAAPEGGARCTLCFHQRLSAAAAAAEREGADFFTTTLTISPLKDAARINAIGANAARSVKPAWLYSDFKKRGGYQKGTALSKQYALYRQNYCGCEFSKRDSAAVR